MNTNFTSLLPFLKALQRQDMPSPEDEDGSNPAADQFDDAGSAAPSEENGGAATAVQSNPVSNTVPGTAQRPATQAPQDTKSDQLMQLLRSGLQGSNPNPLQALAPLAQSNPAPPLGVLPDGSLVQDMGYLQNAPSRIPQAGPDVKPPNLPVDKKQMRATLASLKQDDAALANPPFGVRPDGTLIRDMGSVVDLPSKLPERPVIGDLYMDDLYQLAKGMVPQGASQGKGNDGTPDNISKYLPWIVHGLRQQGLGDTDNLLYALATIRSEASNFTPALEGVRRGTRDVDNTTPNGQPFDKYAQKNGNQSQDDAQRYRGRGFVQLTGKDNYIAYGKAIGHPELVDHPEMANDPKIAGLLLAAYIKDHQEDRTDENGNVINYRDGTPRLGIRSALQQGDLRAARRNVNAAALGLSDFTDAFQAGRKFVASRKPQLSVPGMKPQAVPNFLMPGPAAPPILGDPEQ